MARLLGWLRDHDVIAFPLLTFGIGWLFGLGYFAVAFHWIGYAFFVEADTYLWMMPFMLGALSGGMALVSDDLSLLGPAERALLADHADELAERAQRLAGDVPGGRTRERVRSAALAHPEHVSMEVIEDAGHWVHVDAPDELHAIVGEGSHE